MLGPYSEVDDFSSYDHYEYEMLKYVHILILFLTVMLGQDNLCEIFMLLDKVVVEGEVPTQGLS